MSFNPLFPSMRGTTIFKAFILNALVIGIISAITVEARRVVDFEEYKMYFTDTRHKILATTITGVLAALITMISIRYLFGYGSGSLAAKQSRQTFWK
jgi:hypothetical protein|tara:strand:+ start:251 stop:541 length:291 start_codon:yes stop_codon:yes gene_type:complete